MNFNFISMSKLMALPEGERLSKAVLAFNKKVKDLHAKMRKGAGDALLMGEPKKDVFIEKLAPMIEFEKIYRPVDMRNETNDTYELLNISGGITFNQHVPGGEVKFSSLPAATQTLLKMLRFSAGLPISNDWLKFSQFYKLVEVMDAAYTGWLRKRSQMHWLLMNAIPSSQNTSFSTDIATTINNGCTAVLNDLETAGYANVDTLQFYIQCQRSAVPAIRKALRASYDALSNNNKIEFNIAGIITSNSVETGKAYLSVPGEKNVLPEWEDFNMRPPQGDEKKLGTDYVWTGAYNMALAEVKQHRRISLA